MSRIHFFPADKVKPLRAKSKGDTGRERKWRTVCVRERVGMIWGGRGREGFEGNDLPQIARSLCNIKHWAIVCMLQRHVQRKTSCVLRQSADAHRRKSLWRIGQVGAPKCFLLVLLEFPGERARFTSANNLVRVQPIDLIDSPGMCEGMCERFHPVIVQSPQHILFM